MYTSIKIKNAFSELSKTAEVCWKWFYLKAFIETVPKSIDRRGLTSRTTDMNIDMMDPAKAALWPAHRDISRGVLNINSNMYPFWKAEFNLNNLSTNILGWYWKSRLNVTFSVKNVEMCLFLKKYGLHICSYLGEYRRYFQRCYHFEIMSSMQTIWVQKL